MAYVRAPHTRLQHEVPKWLLVILRPGFRYSRSRDAWILRGIGSSRGPLLYERRRDVERRILSAPQSGRRWLHQSSGATTPMQLLVVTLLAVCAGGVTGAMVSGSPDPHSDSRVDVRRVSDALTPPPILARGLATTPASDVSRQQRPKRAVVHPRPAPPPPAPTPTVQTSATAATSTPAPTSPTGGFGAGSGATGAGTSGTSSGATGQANAAPAPAAPAPSPPASTSPPRPSPSPTTPSSSGGANSGSGGTGSGSGGTGSGSGGTGTSSGGG